MNTITINAKNRAIELSNTFAKAASLFGSEEYRQLQEARHDYPSYRVVTVKQKVTAKAEFVKLSFDFMDKYVKNHANDNALINEYRSLRGLDENWKKDENGLAEDFQIIKDWFLNAVFCKTEMQKVAERSCRLLQLQNVGNCRRSITDGEPENATGTRAGIPVGSIS